MDADNECKVIGGLEPPVDTFWSIALHGCGPRSARHAHCDGLRAQSAPAFSARYEKGLARCASPFSIRPIFKAGSCGHAVAYCQHSLSAGDFLPVWSKPIVPHLSLSCPVSGTAETVKVVWVVTTFKV